MSAVKSRSLLIVEDDLALQKQLKWSLEGIEALCAGDRSTALTQFRRHAPAVVTIDLGLPPEPDSTTEGFRLLEQLLDLDVNVKVIVVTGQSERRHALRAIEMGAYDFIEKPFEPEQLALIADRAFRLYELQCENARLRSMHHSDALSGLLTRDAEMLRIGRMVEKVGASDAAVLLLGESGTGKELLAQGLHHSSRRKGNFVAINCAAIPETLLESELFGFERGAFTGAHRTMVGKIETAHGGTLMLDEIGDLPQALQAKLLRFLEQRTIERIGGRQEIPIDVKIVSATHQDLRALIREGRFREDLYYRLAEIVIEVPPLRRRIGDAVLLAQAFLKRFSEQARRGQMRFSEDALRALEGYEWPGNVRELLNVVKRGAIMAEGSLVRPGDLGLFVTREADTHEGPQDLRTVREQAERAAIVRALARSNGNILRASESLGISRPTLYDLLNRLAIRVDV